MGRAIYTEKTRKNKCQFTGNTPPSICASLMCTLMPTEDFNGRDGIMRFSMRKITTSFLIHLESSRKKSCNIYLFWIKLSSMFTSCVYILYTHHL